MAEKSNQQTFLQVKISRSPNFDPKVVLCTLHTSHARSILKLKLQIPHQQFRIPVNIGFLSNFFCVFLYGNIGWSNFIEITNLLHIYDIKKISAKSVQKCDRTYYPQKRFAHTHIAHRFQNAFRTHLRNPSFVQNLKVLV